VDALAEDLRVLTARVDALTTQVSKLTLKMEEISMDVSDLKGDSLERRYRERAHAYFSGIMRGIHTLSQDEVVRLVEEGRERGSISEDEADEILWSDAIVKGRSRDTGEETYLAIEISWGIRDEDIRRAAERAEILRKLGFKSLPVVAGKAISEKARREALQMKVLIVLDGRLIS